MTSKGKDKTISSPRLIPRATAASAARAAHNATNRSHTLSVKQSVSRSSPINQHKGKNPQNVPKTDSKIEFKKAIVESESFDKDNPSITKTRDTVDEPPAYVTDNVPVNQINRLECRTLPNLLSFPTSVPTSPPMTPQTPRPNSRPTTPAHPLQSQSVPCYPNALQRPVTPQRPTTPQYPKALVRPNTPLVKTPLPSPRTMSPESPPAEERAINKEDIKSLFAAKQKQFCRLKKELDLKQQLVLQTFENLRNLRERMINEGLTGSGEGLQFQEPFEVFNVADWSSQEIAQLCHDASASSATDGAIEFINNTVPIDESAIVDLDTRILNVPTHFAELCLQAFTARQEVIDWVKELIEKDEKGSGEYLEQIARYNNHGLELCEALRALKAHADNAVDTIRHLTKRALNERSALLSVGESLIRETARLQVEMETHATAIKELQELQHQCKACEGAEFHRQSDDGRAVAQQDLQRELEEERASHLIIKEKLTNAESQLRQSRVRINKMDRQLREAEASIATLTGTVKSLEDQSRQKEVQLEARARKLKENLRTGEVTVNQLAQQRTLMQAEIQELKQQIESMNTQHKAALSDYNAKHKELKQNLEEQHQKIQNELVQKADAALNEAQNTIQELNNRIVVLENSVPKPDTPTIGELNLWAELQTTKDSLHAAEEEIATSKREKTKFLESISKISESENKSSIQQKLAAELLSKEEILGNLQAQVRELSKTVKFNEQKVIQYEQFIQDLKEHHRAVINQESPGEVNYEELHQEILNLKMTLLEAIHRNEELSEQLIQNEQQIEQQEKTSHAQARVIKVREELINMLKNKETEQSRELATLQEDLEHRMKIVDEVNKQIAAKADEIQELFATLENKQQQIHRLEKIVLALEEQQRRAQAQRTRHEEKIAALEHELAACCNRKERRYMFF